jgi:hypothetical protein
MKLLKKEKIEMNKTNENILQETNICFALTVLLLNLSILSALFGVTWLVYFLFENVGTLAMFVRDFS